MSKVNARSLFSFIPTTITPGQSKDTGMAMVLIALIVGLSTKNSHWFIGALILLVLDMIVPLIYYPVAKLWLGLSFLLGSIVSKILLGSIFFLVITPLGNLKRVFGSEPLQLRKWKKGADSVFTHRNHIYTASDIEHPF